MTEITLSRRRFLVATGLVLAAPAIVRASSLMPVKSLKPYWVWDGCANFLDYRNNRAWLHDKGVCRVTDIYDIYGTGGLTPNGFYFVKGGSLTLIPTFEDPRFPLLISERA